MADTGRRVVHVLPVVHRPGADIGPRPKTSREQQPPATYAARPQRAGWAASSEGPAGTPLSTR